MSLLAATLGVFACGGARTLEAPAASDLYWIAQGRGPDVVLVGGGGMDLRQWDAVARDLARDHRVLRFDHRGWGRSPAGDTPYSRIEDIRLVLDRAGVDQAVFVGSSFGGGLSLDFALAHPDRVRGLILIGSELGGFEWSDAFVQRGRAFALADDSTRVELLLADPHFIPGAQRSPELRGRARELLRENLARVFELDYSLVRAPDTPAIRRLEDIGVPVVVVTPALDHPDLFAIADTLVARVDGARAIVVPDAGHMVHMERPEAVSALVRDLLGALGE